MEGGPWACTLLYVKPSCTDQPPDRPPEPMETYSAGSSFWRVRGPCPMPMPCCLWRMYSGEDWVIILLCWLWLWPWPADGPRSVGSHQKSASMSFHCTYQLMPAGQWRSGSRGHGMVEMIWHGNQLLHYNESSTRGEPLQEGFPKRTPRAVAPH